MTPKFRPATTADLPAVVTLVNSAYRGDSSRAGWTTEADLLGGQRTDEAMLRAQISDQGHSLLLLEVDGALTGCVYLELETDDAAYLGMLTIGPNAQARGFGKALLAAAERYVEQTWGARRLRMTVIAQRLGLIAWYERRGYLRTGEREPFPYEDVRFGLPKREDLYMVVLCKSLSVVEPAQ